MTSTGRPRTLGATHRYAALLVALLWAGAPILAAVHAQAEVHRFCAEHGTLEEASDAAGPSQATSDLGPAASGAESPAPHDDCAFARCCRFGQLLTQFHLQATADLPLATILLPRPEVRAASLAVIRLAPKTSPPV